MPLQPSARRPRPLWTEPAAAGATAAAAITAAAATLCCCCCRRCVVDGLSVQASNVGINDDEGLSAPVLQSQAAPDGRRVKRSPGGRKKKPSQEGEKIIVVDPVSRRELFFFLKK